jgi:hypothetical protein
VDEGHCRSIGLSDITLEKLQEILSAARIKPSVVQVESHPYLPEWELLDFCREHGIVLRAFAAVGHTLEPNVLADPVVTTIAERVHKTPAQVVLAWSVQRGTAFLTTSTKPQRIRENFDLSALPEDAMREIRDRITTSVRFNSVVETGVPDLFPAPNGSNSAARSRKGESGNLRVPFEGEQGWADSASALSSVRREFEHRSCRTDKRTPCGPAATRL